MTRWEVLSKQPSTRGPAEMITGSVWFDVIARGEEPSRMRVNTVRFAPGSRTAWHGAAPDHFITHVAMWEGLDPAAGVVESEWGDHVRDDEYVAR